MAEFKKPEIGSEVDCFDGIKRVVSSYKEDLIELHNVEANTFTAHTTHEFMEKGWKVKASKK